MTNKPYLRCAQCRELKKAEEFPVDLSKLSGHRGICLACRPAEVPAAKPLKATRCERCGKVAHATKEAAQHHLDALRRLDGAHDMNIYPCGDAWHVGHSIIRFRKRIKRSLLQGRTGRSKANKR